MIASLFEFLVQAFAYLLVLAWFSAPVLIALIVLALWLAGVSLRDFFGGAAQTEYSPAPPPEPLPASGFAAMSAVADKFNR